MRNVVNFVSELIGNESLELKHNCLPSLSYPAMRSSPHDFQETRKIFQNSLKLVAKPRSVLVLTNAFHFSKRLVFSGHACRISCFLHSKFFSFGEI